MVRLNTPLDPGKIGRSAGWLERSEEHTSDSSHMSISYAVFCLKKKKNTNRQRYQFATRQTHQRLKLTLTVSAHTLSEQPTPRPLPNTPARPGACTSHDLPQLASR